MVHRARHTVKSRKRGMDAAEGVRRALTVLAAAGGDFCYTDGIAHLRADSAVVSDTLGVMQLEESLLKPMRHLIKRPG